MVLASFGIIKSEAELRSLCDCTPFGTEALQATDAARKLGFVNTVKCTLNWDELVNQINQGCYPIVFINLFPLDGIKSRHAVVVSTLSGTHVTIYDPLQGQRVLPKSTFETAWVMMNNLCILVRE
jgi:ABC-type bacteriocin/lantibiotic exporter with double-glycine peptidase domain